MRCPSYKDLFDKNFMAREQSNNPSSIPVDLYFLGKTEDEVKLKIEELIKGKEA